MASTYIKLPVVSGVSSGSVDSFNGRTGVVVSQAGDYSGTLISNTPAGTIVATDVQAAINELDSEKQGIIAGSNGKFVWKNLSGDVESLGTHSVDVAGSVNVSNQFDITTAGNVNGLTIGYDANSTENAPNEFFQAEYLQINIDTANSGFQLGTNGAGIYAKTLNVIHNGESNVGAINLTTQNFALGNGTDLIDIKGIGYAFGFGSVNANVNISGPMQGYGFQPNINALAALDANAYTNAFYDAANYGCAAPGYTSANFSPIIASINNNNNYTGLNINPTIPTFTGNAGYIGVSIGGNLGTFNANGYYQGVNVNPTITSARYAAGLQVSMDNVTAYAGVQASLVEQDLTFTFIQPSSFNNSYTLEYTPGAVAGSEVVSIVGFVIEVQIESGVSTATQIKAAVESNMTFNSNITTTISGVGGNMQVVAGPTNFAGGIDAGNVKAAYLDGDVEITGSLTFGGALSTGKLYAYAPQVLSDGGGLPQSVHMLVTQPTIGDNLTVANADMLSVNNPMLLTIGTNSTITTSFVGLAAVGLPAVVTMGAGSTLDRASCSTAALSLDAGGTGGVIDTVDIYRALALPNGVTQVNRLVGYKMDLPFGDPGTDTWGFYESPGVHNYLQGDLLIGGTAGSDDTVTNSSTALEIKSTTKAFLNARMTTTERNALTAINGMQIYNSTTDKLQIYAGGSWVDLH